MNKEIKDFEHMRNMAELKMLSKLSLKTPLTNQQFTRIMELKNKLLRRLDETIS